MNWLNDYHEQVFADLSADLPEDVRAWLAEANKAAPFGLNGSTKHKKPASNRLAFFSIKQAALLAFDQRNPFIFGHDRNFQLLRLLQLRASSGARHQNVGLLGHRP